jgi:hypothetical protein
MQKLKEIVDNDVDVYITLDKMSAMYEQDVQGNHRYLLSELTNDGHVELLKTVVYMVQVDIVSVWNSEDFSSTWRRIYYGDCLVLLKFAKTETVDLERRIASHDERWKTFLGTLKDMDGQALIECALCDRNIRDFIFMPCGHFGTCRACAEEWMSLSDTCPYCRTRIQSIESV